MGSGSFYSPNFPRRGSSATFGLAILSGLNPGQAVECEVEHRHLRRRTWVTAASFGQLTSPGLAMLDVDGLRKVLRLRLRLTGVGGTVHFRVLPPIWRPPRSGRGQRGAPP